ncbi:MAG: HEAT repeat domain-containing protein [Candidatus Omnitrophota bacterium]
MSFIMEAPENIKELVKNANCNYSWETRLAALDVLRKYDCQQSRDVITRLALHDKVYKVKKEAFLAAQALGITKNGNPIRLGKKDIGYKQKDFTKIFLRIKRDKKMEELDLKLFKETLNILNPEMYDVMSYVKMKTFDSWVETTFKGLPKK